MTTVSPRGFHHIQAWVFDLDNTLYPPHLNLWQQVDERIRDYIARFLGVTGEEAFRLQKDYYRRYGTTLRGLMTEHGMAPDDFLDFVHQIDHSPLEPNPTLGAALAKLPGRTTGIRISRRCSTLSPPSSSPSPRRKTTTASWRATASIRARPRCLRIWRAT